MKNILLALTLILLTIASLQAQESSWRGIPIAPEYRCAPYDRTAYPYDPSLEMDIIAAMGGEICSPYNDECYESPQRRISNISSRYRKHMTAGFAPPRTRRSNNSRRTCAT